VAVEVEQFLAVLNCRTEEEKHLVFQIMSLLEELMLGKVTASFVETENTKLGSVVGNLHSITGSVSIVVLPLKHLLQQVGSNYYSLKTFCYMEIMELHQMLHLVGWGTAIQEYIK
jgi:hypothetical protein